MLRQQRLQFQGFMHGSCHRGAQEHARGMMQGLSRAGNKKRRWTAQEWASGTNGTGLWDMLQLGFNWISTNGYTPKGSKDPVRFPVMIGELGSTLAGDEVGISLETFHT